MKPYTTFVTEAVLDFTGIFNPTRRSPRTVNVIDRRRLPYLGHEGGCRFVVLKLDWTSNLFVAVRSQDMQLNGLSGTIELVRPPVLRVVSDSDPIGPNELMQRAAGGDEQAFAQLYEQLGAAVYGIVRKVLRDPSMTEEVTQEVFVQVWRSAAKFDTNRGNAKSWILTIAHRRAVDRIRSEQSRRNRENADHEATVVPLTDDVGDAVASRAESDRVHQALEQIPEAQREVLTLAFFGGKTYREVAAVLEIPEGTAKTRIRDGLTRLRAQLGAI